MTTLQPSTALVPLRASHPEEAALRQAVVAHLARYTGQTRIHTESDLRALLAWCAERRLDPLTAHRVHVELYVRWMQETRRYKPATISRWLSVVIGFYRTAVIDGVLAASPADHVRRPHVPPESPTLCLSHLQFEAMLHAARTSANINDFALVTMLGSGEKRKLGDLVPCLSARRGMFSDACPVSLPVPRLGGSREELM